MELREIYESEASGFYRAFWGACPAAFADVPVLSRTTIAAAPLRERLYRTDPGMIKAVRTDAGDLFLTKRAWTDIRADAPTIASGARTFILMENTDEGLEYALASYERNAVPYLGDVYNLEVALFCAEQFRVTVLLCDTPTLGRLRSGNLIPSSIEQIMVIDRSFDARAIDELSVAYDVTVVLALPETGIIGTVSTADGRLTAGANTLTEAVSDVCTITKPHLITPLVRYATEVPCSEHDGVLFLTDYSSS